MPVIWTSTLPYVLSSDRAETPLTLHNQSRPQGGWIGQQIGLEALYPGATNPFPWMSEMIDLKKERNFFETRVIEYQTGGALSWE